MYPNINNIKCMLPLANKWLINYKMTTQILVAIGYEFGHCLL